MVSSTDPHTPVPLEYLRPHFAAEGLELLAVSDAAADPRAEEEYGAWLDSGAAGEMHYMHTHRRAKFRPEMMLPGCASIVLVGLNYYQERRTDRAGSENSPTGRIARYAWGRDYHKALGKPLKRIARRLGAAYPDHRFRPFTDATPLSERHYASRTALGFRGRNTLLIHETLGSWFFIGEILTTLPVEPTPPDPSARRSCPATCRACIAACPTGALSGPYSFDARLCISYLTIEYTGVIPEELARTMGARVFGCDSCQEVCPLNRGARPTTVRDFSSHIAGPDLPLELLLSLEDDEEVRTRFAGSPVLRAKRRGLVRNATIAAANEGAAELLPLLRRLTADADPVVSEQAIQSLRRLESP